jgi:general secretion pathway protein K
MSPARREQGYATVAAVGAVAIFAYLALEVATSARSAVASADSELARARLSADADAGVAMAVHGLGLADPSQRWRLVGERREAEFNGAALTLSIEDEAGKLPLNFIGRPFIERLFTLAGAEPEAVQSMTEELLALRGGGGGQKGGHALSSLDQLAGLKDMTPAVYARIAPVVTVASPFPAYDPRTAPPLARAVMSEAQAPSTGGSTGPLTPESEKAPSLVGRILTIRVVAADARGSEIRRTAIVELTGVPQRPFVVRSLD